MVKRKTMKQFLVKVLLDAGKGNLPLPDSEPEIVSPVVTPEKIQNTVLAEIFGQWSVKKEKAIDLKSDVNAELEKEFAMYIVE